MPRRGDSQFPQGSLRARTLACSNAGRDRSSLSLPPPRHYPFNSLLRSLRNGDSSAIAKLGHCPITGSLKLNVEPLPASLSTQMRPPCSSTNFLASVSPRPVPSCLREALAPTWR